MANQNSSESSDRDPHEDFLRLFLRHEGEIRAFIRSSLPRPEELDEVMQEVSLVAWRKFPSLEDKEHFGGWCCLIARYEILKFRRSCARDRLLLDEDIIEKLGAQAEEQVTRRQRQLSALDGCFEKLSEEHQKLALAAYAPGASKRELAGQLGRTEGSLYQLLARIRQQLHGCIERSLEKEDHCPS